jgi:photosystem II stability/assembly factor-like uncharacterized protein
MKNAADSRARRRFGLLVLVGVALAGSTVSAGVNVWTTNGPVSTRIDALMTAASSPTTLYAGAGDGSSDSGGGDSGIFKSTDGGVTWRSSPSPLLDYVRVYSLIIDPLTPTTLYAGTFSWDFESGVFKSTDAGVTWTGSLLSTNVFALTIDPSNPAILYAGTPFSGVLKTTNRGASWTVLNTQLTDKSVEVLAVDPSRSATIYAGTSDHVWASGGIIKTEDGGASWTAMNAGLADSPVLALAIDSAEPATLYAGTRRAGVFKSTNGGGQWTAVNTGLTNTDIRALAIDPSAPATLYVGTAGGGVFKSTNGGASWTAMNAGLTNPFVNALVINPSTPARIYAGTDAGVYEYQSTDVPTDRRILPVVGSTPGANGTFFRTSVQLHNPESEPIAGRIVFHPSGAAGSDSDPSLPYSLAPGQTQSIPDLLPAMGSSGVGSADIEITSGSAPIASARVFNDAGPAGTTGFTEQPLRADEAIPPGQKGVLLIPSDLTVARFNVGVRTLEEGASVTLSLKNAAGMLVGSRTRAFPSNYHEQQDAAGFLSAVEVTPGGSIEMFVASGAAIFYGATVDNRTGDPSLQIASWSPFDY